MKATAFAIALLMSGAAVAQTNEMESTEGQQMTTTSAVSADVAMAGNQVVEPSNMNPRRDARGIAVISAPAMVPGGYNGTTSMGTGGPALDTNGQAMGSGNVPACSRTVTDHCLQTYERGRRS